MKIKFNEVIAERSLDLKINKGDIKKVIIQIGKPAPFSKPDKDWYCPFKISGIEKNDIIKYAGGSDSFQALILCLELINMYLSTMPKKFSLTWLGQKDLGFHIGHLKKLKDDKMI